MDIRQYEQGDEHEILELFQLVFKKKMSPEYWEWRFLNNPFTTDILINLMWEKDTLIGQYALSPVELEVNGEIKKAALAMSLMTHPDYQGKKVFANLGENLHSDLKKRGDYHMIFAFPNNQTHSHYGFKKNLFWKDVAVLPMFSAKSQDFRFEQDYNSQFSISNNFDNIVDIINASEKSVKVNKTLKYLKWRYIENPSAIYKIIEIGNKEGIAVYKIIDSFSGDGNYEVDLMEVKCGNDPGTLTSIIKAIINNESDKQINRFNIWKSIFVSDQILFEKLGFKISTPLNYLSYLDFQDDEVISDFRNWEIGMGDSDVF